MFSSQERLTARTGKYGTSRFDYLQQLVTEFQDTEDVEAKKQILANLANFSYDCINYDHMRDLHIIDLFVDMLTEEVSVLVEFGMAGLCNCCSDPRNATVIVEIDGIPLILECLLSPNSNARTVQSALVTLYYLFSPITAELIFTNAVKRSLVSYMESDDKQLVNLAQLLLQKGQDWESAKACGDE